MLQAGNRRQTWVAWWTFAVLAALALPPVLFPDYLLAETTVLLLYLGIALSWHLCSGYTGYISFGHHAFLGIGAYTVALLGPSVGGPWWWWAPLCGGVLAAAISLPLGAILMRLRGAYFAIATLGLAEVVYQLAINWESLTHGTEGLFLRTGFHLARDYWGLYAAVAAVALATWWLEGSPLGLRVLAMREDEEGAMAIGIPTAALKLTLFVASAFFAGLVGGEYANQITYLVPETVLSVRFTLIALVLAVAGGLGSLAGVMVGGLLFGALLLWLKDNLLRFQTGTIGILLLVVTLAAPGGLISGFRRWGLNVERRAHAMARRFLTGVGK